VTVARGDTVTGTSCVSVEAESEPVAGDVAVTVIVAVPGATAVTVAFVPDPETVATAEFDEEYAIVAAVAPAGCVTDDVSCCCAPVAMFSAAGCTLSADSDGGAAETLTVTPKVRVAELKPAPVPVAVTVIVVVPGATAVTTPVVAFTDATVGVDEAYENVVVTLGAAGLAFGTS
jgi:hypothetical protein